jgi:hypothetical protein
VYETAVASVELGSVLLSGLYVYVNDFDFEKAVNDEEDKE